MKKERERERAPAGWPGLSAVSERDRDVLRHLRRRGDQAVTLQEGAAEQVLGPVLVALAARGAEVLAVLDGALHQPVGGVLHALRGLRGEDLQQVTAGDRKRGVLGTGWSVRGDLGGDMSYQ